MTGPKTEPGGARAAGADVVVRIDRVTTRGGDGGQTSLGDGARVSKADPLIDAMGDLDEANAAIGVLVASLTPEHDARATLLAIQSALFDLGADLCQPGRDRPSGFSDAPVAALEDAGEALRAAQAPLTSFVLPGGTLSAAHAHMARAVVRRAERAVIRAARWPDGGPQTRYLNRLSDYLFVLSRHFNRDGRDDIAWVPAARRPGPR